MDSLPIEAKPALQYTFVTTEEGFREMLRRLNEAPRVAVDVEADSLYHYFEKVCLIQISTDSATFILDTLEVRDLSGLAPLMSDSLVEKVFHASGYDLYCLRRDYGFSFANIFDTHIAAQLLGYQFLGLGALLETLLGIKHSKRNQRDDWSRRPLDPGQLDYAAMDTHHLLSLRDLLETELRNKGRMEWAREEFEAAVNVERREKEFDPEGFRRIKGSSALSPREQVVLRALYTFRDEIARKMDVPPFKVLNNSVLVDLAQRPPLSPRQLFGRRGVSSRVARKYGASLVRLIEDARKQDPAVMETPHRNNWKAPGRSAKVRLEALRAWRSQRARELGLPVGVVFPSSLLECMAVSPPADLEALEGLADMRRWRVREFGAELLQLLHQEEYRVDTDE